MDEGTSARVGFALEESLRVVEQSPPGFWGEARRGAKRPCGAPIALASKLAAGAALAAGAMLCTGLLTVEEYLQPLRALDIHESVA